MLYLTDTLAYDRTGDSALFERRLAAQCEQQSGLGLSAMVGEIDALLFNTAQGDAGELVAAFSLRTAYRYWRTLQSASGWLHILRRDAYSPDLLIRESRSASTAASPRGISACYRGEVLRVDDLSAVVAAQAGRGIGFCHPAQIRALGLPMNIALCQACAYTAHHVGYIERQQWEPRVYALGVPSRQAFLQELSVLAKTLQAVCGIDAGQAPLTQIATAVAPNRREWVMLHWLSRSAYAYAGGCAIQGKTGVVAEPAEQDAFCVTPQRLFLPEDAAERGVAQAGGAPARLAHLALACDAESGEALWSARKQQARFAQARAFLTQGGNAPDGRMRQLLLRAWARSAQVIRYHAVRKPGSQRVAPHSYLPLHLRREAGAGPR